MHNEKFKVYDELHVELGWKKGESYIHGIVV
jgi:hypothetical protein